jgi:poly-gamma-glutamate capsule biosynthesis protein CapA/YwtB (metallophosphatase superfamily)
LVFGIILGVLSPLATAQTCGRQETPIADSEVIAIKAVGDIVLGSNWPSSYYPPGFETDVVTRLKQVLGDADVIFGNLEGALTAHDVTTKTTGSSAMFAFRMPASFAPLLRNAGFNVMHIANNHTFDFGEIGFDDTIKNLSDADIRAVGQKDNIVLQKIKDVTIGWVGLSYSWRFDDMNDAEMLADLIIRARQQADLVIVSVQAGAEGSEALRVTDEDEMFFGENRGNVFAFARRAVDLGADLVLGHGPHVLRGMECYKDKLIAYSLGNFAGYGAFTTKRAAAISMVLQMRLAKNGQMTSFEVIPVRFDPQHLPVADPDQLASYLINDLSRLSPLTGTVQLKTTTAGYAKYRAWRSAAELDHILSDE